MTVKVQIVAIWFVTSVVTSISEESNASLFEVDIRQAVWRWYNQNNWVLPRGYLWQLPETKWLLTIISLPYYYMDCCCVKRICFINVHKFVKKEFYVRTNINKISRYVNKNLETFLSNELYVWIATLVRIKISDTSCMLSFEYYVMRLVWRWFVPTRVSQKASVMYFLKSIQLQYRT